MKRVALVSLALAGAVVLVLSQSQEVSGKAHVPIHKAQVCHAGKTIAIGGPALPAHLGHGDCQLPACDFNNVFQTGDPCPTQSNASGECVVPNERDSAEGVTPACPEGSF